MSKNEKKKALKKREHELERQLAEAKAAKKAAKKQAAAVRADAIAAGKKALKKTKGETFIHAPLPDVKPPKKGKKKAKYKTLDDLAAAHAAGEPTVLDGIIAGGTKVEITELPPEQIIAAAERVLAEGGSKGAMKSARVAKEKAEARIAEENDDTEEIKARVQAKRAKRAEGLDLWDTVDRGDAALVAEWNDTYAELTGRSMTSEDEVAARVAAVHGDVTAKIDAVEAEVEKVEAQVAEEIATETGREFAVGSAEHVIDVVEQFGKPSDAPAELESGRNGYKIWTVGEDGKVLQKKDGTPSTQRQFTRVTTYIDNLEDKTALVDWKMRSLLEGVVVNEEEVGNQLAEGNLADELILSKVRDAMHIRDVAIGKARKSDRKGKLDVGELGLLTADALKAFKATMRDLAEQALELGGANVKREKGTDLHSLTEVYDREGMEPINEMLRAEEITPADHADVVAYATALIDAGIEIVSIEQVVVHDGRKHAGRLDRVVLAKTPGPRKTRRRMVADVKTGNIEYGIGKLAQQLEAYASSQAYDLETGERTDMKLDKTVGLVIHLPAGTATCKIHTVDLTIGKKGNGLSAEVRAWRNESKKALDTSVDLAKLPAEEKAS